MNVYNKCLIKTVRIIRTQAHDNFTNIETMLKKSTKKKQKQKKTEKQEQITRVTFKCDTISKA